MAYKSSARGTRPVRLLAVHTAEGARTARSLAAFFARDDVQASSHVGIDSDETLQYVPYGRAAWTLRSGNPISDNAELCGFARWTRAQWLSDKPVDKVASPRRMLRRCSAWIAARCVARGIDVRKLTVVQLAKGEWGVIAHDDWTKAMADGTHWDPGPGFPWDVVIDDARAIARGTTTKEDSMADLDYIQRIVIENQKRIDAVDDKVINVLKPGQDAQTQTLQGLVTAVKALTEAVNNLPRDLSVSAVQVEVTTNGKAASA